MNNRKIILSLVALILSVNLLRLHAQEQQSQQVPLTEKTKSRMLAVGAADVLDTYLSPEKYTGTIIRYLSHSNKMTHWKHITQTIIHQGSFETVSNRADNNDELGGSYNFQYHLRYNWRLTPQLLIAAGGGVDFNLGFLYNTRNTNNPAQLRASLNLAPSVAARYDYGFRNWLFRFSYEAAIPLAGVMFSPNYGQSYYEIFNEGNNDHNIVTTTIGSTPSLRQLFTFDFRPAKKWNHTWVRVGYLGDYQQVRVNHLKYHDYTHLLVIGIVKSGM